MATGTSNYRRIILVIAFCSALYISVGPVTSRYSTSNQQEKATDDGESQDKGLLREKIVHLEDLVNRLENSLEKASKFRNQDEQTKKQSSSGSSQTNEIITQPSSSTPLSAVVVNETVTDHGVKPVVDDGLVYDCSDEDDDRYLAENTLSLYGKPVYAKNKTIMYVTMPKCGSRTLVWTSYKLRKFHHFGRPLNLPYMLEDNQPLKMRKYFDDRLQEADDGGIIHGHYRFIDMNHSPKQPILISMIRDPVDRFMSQFYFMRHGDKDMNKEDLIKKIRNRSNGALPDETIDDCMEKNRDECTSSLLRNIYTTSFCGYDPRCSRSPTYAFQQAKLNVDKFLVIGVMEEYDLSMAVFEKLLPETFGGALKVYEESKDQSMDRSKTSYKKPPSQKTCSILKERMKNEYEIYDFVKNRLHKVAKKLGIGNCSRSL